MLLFYKYDIVSHNNVTALNVTFFSFHQLAWDPPKSPCIEMM